MSDDTQAHETWVILIHNLQLLTPERLSTPHDGRFVREYDPHRHGANLIEAHLVTTADPREAWQFPTQEDAFATVLEDRGARAHDGQPDRPLTAYTVEVMTYEDAVTEFGE